MNHKFLALSLKYHRGYDFYLNLNLNFLNLLTIKFLIILRILSLLDLFVVNFLSVIKYLLEGKTLLLEIYVH